jgi:hypothetical protein
VVQSWASIWGEWGMIAGFSCACSRCVKRTFDSACVGLDSRSNHRVLSHATQPRAQVQFESRRKLSSARISVGLGRSCYCNGDVECDLIEVVVVVVLVDVTHCCCCSISVLLQYMLVALFGRVINLVEQYNPHRLESACDRVDWLDW